MEIVLASKSPRRLDLLRQIGIEPKVDFAQIDEESYFEEDTEASLKKLAYAKAEAIAKIYPSAAVIGADTIVLAKSQILTKPKDEEDVARMLNLLSDAWHEVLSGVCVISPKGVFTDSVKTVVSVSKINDEEIERYIQSREWEGKAGAYAIQGYFSAFVESICGSYSNVVGLPLCQTYNLLKEATSCFKR